MRYTLTLFFFLFCTSSLLAQLKGKVVGISDGDTFTLLTEDKQRIKIRVYGIDCPESGQDYGMFLLMIIILNN
jgi:micrococcal nuclease